MQDAGVSVADPAGVSVAFWSPTSGDSRGQFLFSAKDDLTRHVRSGGLRILNTTQQDLLLFHTLRMNWVQNFRSLSHSSHPAARAPKSALTQQQKPFGQSLDDGSLSEQEILDDLR